MEKGLQKTVRSTLGARLRSYRDERQLTQSQLAKAAGVSQAMISQVERGERELPLSAADRLSATLNADPSIFIGHSSAAKSVEALQAAWDAYDEARSHYSRLAQVAARASAFLRTNRTVIRDALERKDLDTLDLEDLPEELGRTAPNLPDRTSHPGFRLMPAGSVRDESARAALMNLLSECEELSPQDLTLVKALVRWLRDQRR